MTPDIIQGIAENSPLAAVAIVAMLILFKVMEQKVKMAEGIAHQHEELAARYKELCDSSQTWGQQWTLALSQNTQAFNANMKQSAEMKDVIKEMKDVIVDMKNALTAGKVASNHAEAEMRGIVSNMRETMAGKRAAPRKAE